MAWYVAIAKKMVAWYFQAPGGGVGGGRGARLHAKYAARMECIAQIPIFVN